MVDQTEDVTMGGADEVVDKGKGKAATPAKQAEDHSMDVDETSGDEEDAGEVADPNEVAKELAEDEDEDDDEKVTTANIIQGRRVRKPTGYVEPATADDDDDEDDDEEYKGEDDDME